MQISYTTGSKKSDAAGYKTLGIFFGRMLLIISLTILAMLFGTSRTSAQQDGEDASKSSVEKVKAKAIGNQAVVNFIGSLKKAI